MGAESSEHLDCLARILELTLLIAGIRTDDIKKGMGRFKISDYKLELNAKQERDKRLVSWKL